jgi:hypothetical protein
MAAPMPQPAPRLTPRAQASASAVDALFASELTSAPSGG